MSHQPFETYLFSDEPLTAEQQQSLDAHLKTCERCCAFSYSLNNFDTALRHSPSPLPAPGFTQRWQTRLVAHQQARQSRKLWLMTLGLFALASVTLLILFLFNIYQLNWAYELSQAIARFSIFAAYIRHFTRLMRTLISNLPILVPIMVLVMSGTSIALSALIITWFKTLIYLYTPGYERGNLS